jgi:hypothetical protein
MWRSFQKMTVDVFVPSLLCVCKCDLYTRQSVFSPLLNPEEGDRKNELTTTIDACVHVFNLYKCRVRHRDWSLTLQFLCSTPNGKRRQSRPWLVTCFQVSVCTCAIGTIASAFTPLVNPKAQEMKTEESNSSPVYRHKYRLTYINPKQSRPCHSSGG